jgi:hypothetical protein
LPRTVELSLSRNIVSILLATLLLSGDRSFERSNFCAPEKPVNRSDN